MTSTDFLLIIILFIAGLAYQYCDLKGNWADKTDYEECLTFLVGHCFMIYLIEQQKDYVMSHLEQKEFFEL